MNYMGLNKDEVRQRLKIYGYNTFKRKKLSNLRLFFSQFKNPFIYLLFITATLSYGLGETTDALIILLILLVSGIIGFYQESSANKSVEKLLSMVKTSVAVIRDGKKEKVPAEEIVPGDIVILSAGDIVPADILLLEARDFYVDESLLTGEAYPEEKHKGENVYMGTSVVSGYGIGKVERTGKLTHYGQIVEKIKLGREETDFERGLKQLGFVLFQIASVMIVVVFAINAYFHKGVMNSLLYALSVGIGITPFLLPVIVNTTLLQGAKALARNGVIIKRLASLYNMGNTRVLCMDKTGTLTWGRMEVLGFINLMEEADEKVRLYASLNALMQTGYKNPIDDAIISISDKKYLENFSKLDEVPFDFQRKRLSVLIKDGNGNHTIITKGAYRKVIEICSYALLDGRTLNIGQIQEEIEEVYKKYSKQGYKVLALAYKDVKKYRIKREDERDMILAGFILLHDPIKPDAKELIQQLLSLGVDIRIITGDNALVARRFAQEVGLPQKVISGDDLRNYPPEALPVLVKDTYIFAELDPMQKEDVVLALKRLGNVVGYVGDGANDLLAMRASDVAISVQNAMDVVKENADILLAKLDLLGISQAIVMGRKAFINSMKYAKTQTSSNFGNMFSVIGASVLLPFIPLLPYQVLTLNLLADLSFLTLSSDNVDEEKLKKPTSWDTTSLRKFIIFFGPVSSLFDYATFFYALYFLKASPDLFRSLWFLESLVTQSLVLLFLRTERVAFLHSKPSKMLMLTILGIIAFGFLLPYVPLGRFINLYPLPASSLIFVICVAFLYSSLVELLKRFYYMLSK